MNYIFKNKFYMILAGVIDAVGTVLFLPFFLFKKRTPGEIKNILVIRLDHIGDVVYSTVISKSLKENYKDAKVTFLVGSWARDIVINDPNIDEIICYDAPWFKREGRRNFILPGFFKIARELKKHHYDLGIDPRGDIRHILLMMLAGVKFRIGYGITGGSFLLHKSINYKRGRHLLERNLDLLRASGIAVKDARPNIYASEGSEEFTRAFLKKSGISEQDLLVIIHPLAGYISKNWLAERFSELISIISSDYQAKIIVIGSEADKKKNDFIIKKSRVKAINAAGALTLGELPSLIKRASIFIGVDSAPSHIAGLLGRPGVILYSGTNDPGEWAPLNDNMVIIQKDISCKGCQRLDCRQNICMDLISVDDVLEAVQKVINP